MERNNYTNMSETQKMEPGEVYDETDLSQMRQLHEIEALTKEKRHKPEYHPDFDGVHCVDCFVQELTKERLEDHRVRCVDCQSLLEKRTKRR